MSRLINKFRFFKKLDTFSDSHGMTIGADRGWEDGYRTRWQYDKIVRSTHGVNCTGSCSWKIYVKNGLVMWETQQTDYPETRPDLPNHEPRGCPRGASYSWYLYSANRIKYPQVRKQLLTLWREAIAVHADPVDAWASIVEDPIKAKSYKTERGMGGFVRLDWKEANTIIAASNIYTTKTFGPDRISGFSPIPAMSMVSYSAGARYLSLLGGNCLSFYDWYCDLPPSSPQVWGEQTDVPESADWYNSDYLLLWGSNVPQTRTPDAHFMTEVRYKGTKVVVVSPDYNEAAKFADQWLSPKQGTDAAMAMAMGHVILQEFFVDKPSAYFHNYAKRYTDMPNLILLDEHEKGHVTGRFLRASDLANCLDETNHPEWKTLAWDNQQKSLVCPNGSIGFRWDKSGQWNLKNSASNGDDLDLALSLLDDHDALETVALPYFGCVSDENNYFQHTNDDEIQYRKVPVKKLTLADGRQVKVTTVFDVLMAQYGINRGIDDALAEYQGALPNTPEWQTTITGVPAEHVTRIAREFAFTADKTHGRAMVILGAGLNHWFHTDMAYRAIINVLMMCGCIGQSGGGWAHYVGQEKLRPQTGWAPMAFGLDWTRPPRHMNGTSFFYNHTNQWRYEKLEVDSLLSPLADRRQWEGNMIDFNVKAERMGWLPSAPQLAINPLTLSQSAKDANLTVEEYTKQQLVSGKLQFACEDPDNPINFPRILFVWRSNLLGSSAKGAEYFMRHLLGTQHGVNNQDLGEEGRIKPKEVVWKEKAPEGKVDLLVTLDFRMSTTCLYSDIVLPTATWYEKDDLNTSDMHPFIHPFNEAVSPCWESKSDWNIFKGFAERFSQLTPNHLGIESDLVTVPLQHDSIGELAQPFGEVKDWRYNECEAIPGITMPALKVVTRDYPNLHHRFTTLGPKLDELGNGGKGINWQTGDEIENLKIINRTKSDDDFGERPSLETAANVAEAILTLAPETNGKVALKAWQALTEKTGIDHSHLVKGHESKHIRFRELSDKPQKIITSPTWSGIESEEVSYNAGYTNVNELIPWRTLTGRQQYYMDHQWMRDFGEALCGYKPPINTQSLKSLENIPDNGNKIISLNFVTPHQKWGIHSTYSDNLLMLTLSRGGPVMWLSEVDAERAGIQDNDWIEAYNVNGNVTARAIVSQRLPQGLLMMYHAQERLVNVPASEITKKTGGIHNSVCKIELNPVHMIGGYAQFSYGFNYYGTIGSNRDEFVFIRKMNNVNWLDDVPLNADELVMAKEIIK